MNQDLIVDIENVRNLLLDKIGSQIPLINSMIHHSFKKNGKNIRTQILLSTAIALEVPTTNFNLYLSSVIIELIHAGSLAHDDVIDQNPIRRGQLATHEAFSNTKSILLGDYFFTKAYLLAHELPSKILFLDYLAQTAHDLVEGEFIQLEYQQQEITLDIYLKIISKKTASLFSLATTSVGMLFSPEHIKLLLEIGSNFGIFFQLIDDYLDYFGSESLLGKASGHDFKEKKMTLPLFFINTNIKNKFLEKFFNNLISFEETLEILNTCKFECQSFIESYALKTISLLKKLPNKEPLTKLIEDRLSLITMVEEPALS